MSFPIDWNEWTREWKAWKERHKRDLQRPEPGETQGFEGKNFLADEILGRWKVNGRIIELSEVVFPNLTDRDAAIGITELIDGHMESGGVAYSFEELEQELGIQARAGRGPNRGGLSR